MEKETWKNPPEANAAQENWEGDKAELVKSRDEAVTQAKVKQVSLGFRRNSLMSPKVAREDAEKLREVERGLRMSNVIALAGRYTFHLSLTRVQIGKARHSDTRATGRAPEGNRGAGSCHQCRGGESHKRIAQCTIYGS